VVQIGLEITHACNRSCPLCSHRIASSPYTYLTMEQYEQTRLSMEGLDVREILITGGEPLVHPNFKELMARVRADFPRAALLMATNGTFVDTLSPAERACFKRITVSYYGPFNRDVVRKIVHTPGDYPNVHIVDSTRMFDPYRDPCLNEEQARVSHSRCDQRCIRIIGTRVYGCCLAEGTERYYKTPTVHMEIAPGWMDRFPELPTCQACRHCWYAQDLLQSRGLPYASVIKRAMIRSNHIGHLARLVNRRLMRAKLRKTIGLPAPLEK
jgi:hypothetical protein